MNNGICYTAVVKRQPQFYFEDVFAYEQESISPGVKR